MCIGMWMPTVYTASQWHAIMVWMPRDLVVERRPGTLGLHFVFLRCARRARRQATFERMKKLIAASVPEFQLVPGRQMKMSDRSLNLIRLIRCISKRNCKIMLQRDRQIRTQVHQLTDACLFAASFWLAYVVPLQRNGSARCLKQSHSGRTPFMQVGWLYFALVLAAPLVLESQGFYNRPVVSSRRQLFWPLLKGCVIVTIGMVLLLFCSAGTRAARRDDLFRRHQFRAGLAEGGIAAGGIAQPLGQGAIQTPHHPGRHAAENRPARAKCKAQHGESIECRANSTCANRRRRT